MNQPMVNGRLGPGGLRGVTLKNPGQSISFFGDPRNPNQNIPNLPLIPWNYLIFQKKYGDIYMDVPGSKDSMGYFTDL